jgi:N-methylhydantoinase B
LLDAQYPSAVSAGNVETSQRLVDALFGALSKVLPGLVPAASCGTMNNVLFGGIDPRPGPRQGASFVHYETLAGGAGASALGPGADAIHCHMTNTRNTPIEALERSFPVRVERYAVRPIGLSRGEGDERPGGAGVVRAYRFLADAEVTLITDRRRYPPWGIGGASPGALGENWLERADGVRQELAGKLTLRLKVGDLVEVHTPGGGGYRAPAETTIGTKSTPQTS